MHFLSSFFKQILQKINIKITVEYIFMFKNT